MAKLSARGRTELVRLSKAITEQAGTMDTYESTRFYAIMSDKHVLKKTQWRDSAGKLQSMPWNDLGKLSGEIEDYVQKLRAAGYNDTRS